MRVVRWSRIFRPAAGENLKKTLALLQQAGERQETAAVYHQLGMVAEEEKDYAATLGYYAFALEIFMQYKDEYSIEMTIGNLAILMRVEEWDAGSAIAALSAPDKIKEFLRMLLAQVQEAPPAAGPNK